MTRISTYAMNNMVMYSTLNAENAYATATEQQASGLISSDFKGLASSSRKMLNLQGQMSQMRAYQTNTTASESRCESMYGAVGTMISIMTSLRTQISSTSATQDYATALSKATSLLGQLGNTINTNIAGRYLFAGSKTDTPPFNLTTYQSQLTTTSPYVPAPYPNLTYYQGDSTVQSVSVSDQQVVSYGVTGNHSAIEEAVRACAIVMQAASKNDMATMQSVMDLASTATKDLSNLQEAISASASSLATSQSTQTTFLSLTQTSVSDIKNVDVASVTLLATQLSTQLQSSYKAAAGTMKLNLASYL